MKIKMTRTAAGPFGVRLAGHVYDLADEEALRLLTGGAAVPVAEVAAEERELAIAPPEETRDAAIDTTTHGFNAADCVDLIGDIADAGELERLHAGERAHPNYTGGRKTVLDAIEERLGELEVEG